MKNPMHEGDRECAKSLVCNLVLPDPSVIAASPYLNKVPQKEPILNLLSSHLHTLAQITQEQQKLYRGKAENDMERDRQKELALVRVELEKKRNRPVEQAMVQ